MEISKVDRASGRISYIDFLKFIGLTAIILAHVGSPGWVLMLRSFDVPFMVILSSILAERSFRKYEGGDGLSIKGYYISRAKRLVIPTWIFLIIFFAVYFMVGGEFRGIPYYIASFCFTRYGIGYVWVILIYLYSALLIPLFSRLKLSMQGLVAVLGAYVLYEIAYYYQIGTDIKFIETTVYYIIPYGLLTYLGYNYCRIQKHARYMILVTSFAVFAVFGAYYWFATGTPQPVEIVKYPPRLYYLSYGIACSFGLLLFCEKHDFKIYGSSVIQYISEHSLWIYLWHILVLTAYSDLGLPEVWYIKLLIVYAITLLIIYMVNKCLDAIEKTVKLGFFKYLRG